MAAAQQIPKRLTHDSWKPWIQGMDAFLFDCDGGAAPAFEFRGRTPALTRGCAVCMRNPVLWRGDAAIAGAANMIELLRSLNKRVVFVVRLARVSEGEGKPGDSAWATVQYMKQQKIEGKVYMVGEIGLKTELENEGYQASGMEHSDVKGLPNPFVIDKETKAVVVGLDRYSSRSWLCVRRISPPEAVCGKPSQDLLKTIMSTYNLDPSRTCMVRSPPASKASMEANSTILVGDRLSTDIEFGNVGGLHTLLVLTGITHESELNSIDRAEHVPDHYVQSVDVLNQLHAETLKN
ncbi:hypothetical protein BBJ28_00009076 [Nothophytophthora sp. Chile5]|nr:hypothetical protein BBJ28_00009076 [Nothophytophthora sp. Chile5]